MYLAKMTTAQAKEAFEKDPIIVIPVGSTEQHGTQGALGTDFMVPSYLADHVEDVDNVIVAPTVPYGVCPYHLSFEGSINIGYEGLYMVLHGIMDSLMQHGAKRFVVLNGHGGNTPSIDRAALEVYHNSGCRSIPNRNPHTKLLIKDFQAFVLPFPVSWNKALRYLPCR